MQPCQPITTLKTQSTDTSQDIAVELLLRQVLAAVELLDTGNTIPFITRYRKEATQGIDEIALRSIEDALERIKAMKVRKTTGA